MNANHFEQIDVLEPKISVAPPLFSDGEKFDPDFELDKIKKMSTADKELALPIYRQKLLMQKIGINEMIVDLSKKFLDNNKIDAQDISEFLENAYSENHLSAEQIITFRDSVDEFIHKRDFIEKFTKDFLDENGEINSRELFKKIFNFEPSDDIRVEILPAAIYFHIKNLNDYARTVTNARIEGRPPNQEEIKQARDGQAAVLFDNEILELKGSVIVAGPVICENPHLDQQVIDHEYRHVINNIILQYQIPEYSLYAKGQVALSGLSKEVYLNNCFVLERAKDEISAYYNETRDTKFISRTLLKEDTIYQFFKTYNSTLDLPQDKIPKEFLKVVEKGIVAYGRLLVYGLTDEQAHALLIIEKLADWPKVVERYLGVTKGINRLSLKQKQNNLQTMIDQRILKKTEK